MKIGLLASYLAVALGCAFSNPAHACGFGEAPTSCDNNNAEREAKWMLGRVVTAVEKDKAQALQQFARGEAGFRTADTYVFCIGPDSVMSAHPSALLQGQDVRGLRDKTGNHFISAILKTARSGQVTQTSSLFPRSGIPQALPEITFYTRAGDQVCGIGVYDGEEGRVTAAPLEERMAQLRKRLDSGMRPELRGDWMAYLETLKEQNADRNTVLTKVNENVKALEAVLASNADPSARSEAKQPVIPTQSSH